MEVLPEASSHQRDQKRIRVAKLKERRNKFKAIMMYKTINGMAPKYMEDMFSQHSGNFIYVHPAKILHCCMLRTIII